MQANARGLYPDPAMVELWEIEPRVRSRTRVYGAAGAFCRALLRAALPPLCPLCREPLAQAGGVCAPCWRQLSFVARPFCERLGTPLPDDVGGKRLSAEAVADPPVYDRARAAVRYDDRAGALVHALKYGDRLDLAPTLGRWMAAAGRDILGEAQALLPVPLHRRRLWARRFNQSAALAQAVGGLADIPVLYDALARTRHTPQQVGHSRPERVRNVEGAFAVPPNAQAQVGGRRLVLVDDVLTSGATVEACARALRRAGAASVDVLVFARVVMPGRPPI